MQADAIVEMLERIPVFGGLRESALRLLLEQANQVRVARGSWFFHEGDVADSMFLLQGGRVSVIKGWQGRSVLLGQLGGGDCFGEMALMDLMPRSASVRADEDCLAVEFSAGDLLVLYEHDVEQFALLQMNLAREVCRRLRATDELLFRARMGDGAALPAVPIGRAA
ncbi:MAG TPA: Crp/Fnr family transcriptional regulator [Rubrivivax sp.]|jgi:CRP-like cAMP-binding protein|nr:Crp/Fnr family transcriptional regulator [Rubrivivax sp.]